MPDHFHVTYLLTLSADEDAEKHIRALQLEQSAELPGPVVRSMDMEHVLGRVAEVISVASSGKGAGNGQQQLLVTIAWPDSNLGNEITQLLNILFGNISMKTGIVITDIRWEDLSGGMTAMGGGSDTGNAASGGERIPEDGGMTNGIGKTENDKIPGPPGLLSGPAFGIEQIRAIWGIHGRSMGCTALKTMGLSSQKLSDLAFRFALGGVDIIKDDHGLTDQHTAPFTERVRRCVEAVDRAAQKTGRRSRYFPNITADPHHVVGRYEMAAELGADGVLLCPMLVGPALMHHLARLDIELPIMAHPAFSGPFAPRGMAPMTAPHGFDPGLFYGGLMRALGADFTIYPNTSGRFSFRPDTCKNINDHARRGGLPFARCFPTPGGGMQRDRMSYWLDAYGTDTTFLMGGSLFEDPAGIEASAQTFMEVLGA